MGGRGAYSASGKRFIDRMTRPNNGKHRVHEMDISKFEGMTLEQIERRIRNLAHEELFVFDKNDKPIMAFRGSKNAVAYPVAIERIEGATVTHGHPKGVANFGGAFSIQDVLNMAGAKWREHRATASGQGEMNYIMRRTSKSNGDGLIRRVNADSPSLNEKMSSIYVKTYNSSIRNGSTHNAAVHVARQKAVGMLNRYWKDTLPEYGFEYVTRKEDYTYNR